MFELLADNPQILIYGTGTMARDIHRVLTRHRLRVLGFVDHVVPGTPLPGGTRLFTPAAAAGLSANHKDSVVVLGIHNYQVDTVGLVKRLNALGFSRVITPIQLYDQFGDELGVRYWLTSRSFYSDKRPSLERAAALWSDDKSRALFWSVMEFRLTGEAGKLPAPEPDRQYYPPDIPPWRLPLRLMDCGAFEGDTLAAFTKAKMPIEAVAAFEPDAGNFRKLVTFVGGEHLQNVSLWPCGVYSETTQLAFDTGNGMASGITKSGKTIIQCVSLDEALPTFRPNLIKMDIEGAEYEALLGARGLISAHTPGLAISLYHRPEHLWQLPLLVEELAPGKYRYFMRLHAYNDFELVMYAIPVEEARA